MAQNPIPILSCSHSGMGNVGKPTLMAKAIVDSFMFLLGRLKIRYKFMTWFKKNKKESSKLPKDRECPYCKKTINAEAEKCPYCQSNVTPISLSIFLARRNKIYQIILLIIITPIVLLVLILLVKTIFWGDNPVTQQTSIPSTSQVKPQSQQQGNTNTDKKINISNLTNLSNNSLVKLYGKVTRSATMTPTGCLFIIYDNTGKALIFTGTETLPSLCPEEGPWVEVNGIYVKEGVPTCGDAWIKGNTKSHPSFESQLRDICDKFNLSSNTPVVASVPEAILLNGKPISESAKQTKSKPVPVPQPVVYNWSNFSKINFSDYVKNPPTYLNQQIKFSGMVTDFLAAGDRGGDTNFIAITDYTNPIALKIIMLRIDNASEYKKATTALNASSDLIVAYGVGVISQESTNGLTMPVVKVLRLDKCDLTTDAFCSDGTTQILFSANQ